MGVLVFSVNQFMEKMLLVNSSSMSIFIIMLLVALFSWFYVLTHLQMKKHPNLLNSKRWHFIPILLIILGGLSFAIFIMLSMNGRLFELMNQWKWLMLVILLYFIGIYFYFILSVVLKVSQNKEKALSITYILSIISLLIIFMLSP